MTRYPLYIFDLDGTLYRGDDAIPQAVETLRTLKRDGAKLRYLTNNSGQTPKFFREKLAHMGFPVETDEIYSSGTGSASHLQALNLRSIFVVGEPGLVSILESEGLRVVNAGFEKVVVSEGAASDAVLVGICRHFNYGLLAAAMERIRDGQPFVATNSDPTLPIEGNRLMPGAGCVVAAVRTCSEVQPFVVGKPNPYLVTLAMQEAGVEPRDALVVGDRLDTDIESGIRAGCPTHLVLTGVTRDAPKGQSASSDLTGLL